MKRIATTVLTSLLLASPAFAIGQARITITVVDAEGNPLSGAKLQVTGTKSRAYDQSFESDEKGRISLVVNDGTVRYDFVITKDGFVPWKQTIKMQLLPLPNEKTVRLTPVTAIAPPPPVETASTLAAVAYNEGVALANAGSNDEAIAKFEEAVRKNSSLTAGYAALTRVYARTEAWDKVIDRGEKALDLGGDDDAILALVAEAYEKKGDKEKAGAFRKRIPETAAVIFNKAVPLLNAGKDDEAEPILLKAIDSDESFARAHYELGMLYARQGKNAEARAHLERYLELDPEGENAEMAKEMLKYLK